MQKFLLAIRNPGRVVSKTIAIATARALIARNLKYNLGHLKINSSWAQSLFQRMGFKRWMRTTGKVEIPEGTWKEAELLYLHYIISIVEKHNIPSHLVMNLDQTSLKYVQRWIIQWQKRIHPQSQSPDHLIKEVSLALSL